jgi:hypothetical protein
VEKREKKRGEMLNDDKIELNKSEVSGQKRRTEQRNCKKRVRN